MTNSAMSGRVTTRPPRPPHVPLRVGPPAALGLHQRLGHRLGDGRAALLVVLAFGDLADELVVRRLGRGAGDVRLVAVHEHPRERAGPLVGRTGALVLEQQVGAGAKQLALGLRRESSLGDVCIQHWHQLSSLERAARLSRNLELEYYTYMHVRDTPHSNGQAPAVRQRSTQAERSARTQSALLESAARGLSRYGYGNLVLEQVAREAGYTRGALYHQFRDKEDLALAVLQWINETWWREVGGPAERESDPVAALLALARGHAVYCRRDVARVIMALRVEFSGQDHPVGREIKRVSRTLVKRCVTLINAGRRDGSIPPGPPARTVALAFWGALEGAVIALAGEAPHDELLAARAVAGVLGLDSQTDWAMIP